MNSNPILYFSRGGYHNSLLQITLNQVSPNARMIFVCSFIYYSSGPWFGEEDKKRGTCLFILAKELNFQHHRRGTIHGRGRDMSLLVQLDGSSKQSPVIACGKL